MQELNVNEIDEVAGGLLPESSVGGNTDWEDTKHQQCFAPTIRSRHRMR